MDSDVIIIRDRHATINVGTMAIYFSPAYKNIASWAKTSTPKHIGIITKYKEDIIRDKLRRYSCLPLFSKTYDNLGIETVIIEKGIDTNIEIK